MGAERASLGLRGVEQRSVADHGEHRVGEARSEARRDSHESVGPLHGRESPDVRHDVARAAQPEQFAREILRGRYRQVDAGCHHVELLQTADAGRDEVIAHLSADGDEARRASRESAFRDHDRVRGRGVEVPTEQVSVVRVDRRRDSREACRDAAQHPGLGLVRVHDVGPELADDLDDGDEGSHIVSRPWRVPETGHFRHRQLRSRESGRSPLHRTSRCR